MHSVLARARSSWTGNLTRSDPRARQKQLHGLYNLLMDGRDDILELLATAYDTPSTTSEIDFAAVIKDIAQHFHQLENESNIKFQSTPWGLCKSELRPTGVLLLSVSEIVTNTLKSLCSPIAAALAAGNIVVIARSTSQHALLDYLDKHSKSYMNSDSFLIAGDLEINASVIDAVDRLIIFDDQVTTPRFPNVFHKTLHINPNDGINLVIFGNDPKKWKIHEAGIQLMLPYQAVGFEALQAMFVPIKAEEAFMSLSFVQNERHQPSNSDINSALQAVSLGEKMVKIDLTVLLNGARTKGPKLGSYLAEAKQNGRCIVIIYSSLDQVIDAIKKCGDKIKSTGYIGSPSDNAMKYLNSFVASETFYVNRVPLAIPFAPGLHGSWATIPTATLYPKSLFTDVHTVIMPRKGENNVRLTISQLRAGYEKLIKPLPSDARGERTGFFDQAKYAIMGVGSVLLLGFATTTYYVFKAFVRR